MKHTLRSKVIECVQPYLGDNGLLARGSYNQVKNQIHTDVVHKTVRGFIPNRVLGSTPPALDKNEG